jgi:hypothetical protein
MEDLKSSRLSLICRYYPISIICLNTQQMWNTLSCLWFQTQWDISNRHMLLSVEFLSGTLNSKLSINHVRNGFSGDAVECLSWSQVKHRRAWSAPGWVPAACNKNGGSVVTLVFDGGLFQVVPVELWVGMRVCPGTEVASSVDNAIGYRHERRILLLSRWGVKHSERTHVKLRGEASMRGGSVVDSIRGILHYFAKELAFLAMR